MIRKRNGKYSVVSKDGKKKLGSYRTRQAAIKRLQQIEYWKHKKG